MPTKLFIGNISDSCTEDDLKQHFQGVGKIVEHAIIRNYGFVHFESYDDAQKAIQQLNNSSLKGSLIRVQISRTPHKTGAGRERLREGYASSPDNMHRGRYGPGRQGPHGPGGNGYDREPRYGGYPPRGDRYHPYHDRYSRDGPPPASWGEQQYGSYDSGRAEPARGGYEEDSYYRYPPNRYSDYYSRQRYEEPVRYPEHGASRY